VVIKKKFSQPSLYTIYETIKKKRETSKFLAPCWNISLKSGDVGKTSSKSTEEHTELKEVSPFMA